jgi:hypothetical protein
MGDEQTRHSDNAQDQGREHNAIRQAECTGMPIVDRCQAGMNPTAFTWKNLKPCALHKRARSSSRAKWPDAKSQF